MNVCFPMPIDVLYESLLHNVTSHQLLPDDCTQYYVSILCIKTHRVLVPVILGTFSPILSCWWNGTLLLLPIFFAITFVFLVSLTFSPLCLQHLRLKYGTRIYDKKRQKNLTLCVFSFYSCFIYMRVSVRVVLKACDTRNLCETWQICWQ